MAIYFELFALMCILGTKMMVETQTLSLPYCKVQLNFFAAGLEKGENWALEFLDLSAKIPTGLLHSNTKHVGMFDECLNYKKSFESLGDLTGQYCKVIYRSVSNANYGTGKFFDASFLGHLLHKYNIELESHLCLPDYCTEEELNEFLNEYFKGAKIHVNSVKCIKKKKLELSSYDCIFITVLIGLSTIIILSTCYDYWHKDYQTKSDLLASFSFYTNTKELLEIDHSPPKNIITCFYGLRVIAALLIVLRHRFFQMPMSRHMDYDDFYMKFRTDIGRYAVNVFFLLAAILVTRTLMVTFEKKKLILLKFYFHRYMRYAPSMAILAMFLASFIPVHLATGPFTNTVEEQKLYCGKYWWSAMLMIQNYWNIREVCVSHSWYISADFQLFLISPLLVYLLWKYKLKTMIFYAVFIGVKLRYEHTVPYDFFNYFYFLTHFRLSQWLIGLVFGYIIYKLENSTVKFNLSVFHPLNVLLWLGIGACGAYLYYSAVVRLMETTEAHENIFYMVHTVMMGLIIMSCMFFPKRNLLQWFLSHPLWQPLSKLTLSIYLIHWIYLFITGNNFKDLAHYDSWWMFHIFLGDVMASIMLATVLYLCIEAPFSKILSCSRNKNYIPINNKT